MATEERHKRIEQKASHTARIERDKMNRQKEKQKIADRKEKEKKRTQKRERRR